MRQVFLVRHAEAEDAVDAAHAGRPDEERWLTDSGKRDMRRGAEGLAALVEGIALILTSPLTRAVQTAELLHADFPEAKLKQHAFLTPGSDPAALLPFPQPHIRPLPRPCGLPHQPTKPTQPINRRKSSTQATTMWLQRKPSLPCSQSPT